MNLSIIIALFNTDQYIEECIKSIYLNNNLLLEDFEVIVINDGSTDNSKNIVLQLTKEYSNLILLNKENGGQSSARNVGFYLAKGKYILCLDSDDYIDGSKLDFFINKGIKYDLDIIAFDCVTIDAKGANLRDNKYNYKSASVNTVPVVDFVNKNGLLGAMCLYFYKREILITNNLRLTEGIKHEDEEFVTLFFSLSNFIGFYNYKLYYYRIHNMSSMNNEDLKLQKNLVFDLVIVSRNLRDQSLFISNDGMKGIIQKKYSQLLISLVLKSKNLKFSTVEKNHLFSTLHTYDLYPFKIYSILSYKKRAFLFLLNNKVFKKLFYYL